MTIKEIFDSMAYGPAPESASEALAWIAKHQGSFGHFIDGQFTAPGQTFTTHNAHVPGREVAIGSRLPPLLHPSSSTRHRSADAGLMPNNMPITPR